MKRCKICGDRVICDPDKSKPSRLVEVLRDEGTINERRELDWQWDSIPISAFCYYHDKKARGLL